MVDCCSDETKYDAMRRGLGQQVPDREQRRNSGIFPRVTAMTSLDHQSLGQDREQEDGDEDHGNFVRQSLEELGKAQVN